MKKVKGRRQGRRQGRRRSRRQGYWRVVGKADGRGVGNTKSHELVTTRKHGSDRQRPTTDNDSSDKDNDKDEDNDEGDDDDDDDNDNDDHDDDDDDDVDDDDDINHNKPQASTVGSSRDQPAKPRPRLSTRPQRRHNPYQHLPRHLRN